MSESFKDLKEKWDNRYRVAKKRAVSEYLKRFYSLAPKGRALDIACGVGHNALFLAQNGFFVDCVDISQEALKQFSHPNIDKFCMAIEDFDFKKYTLIVCFNFLERSIFPKMISSLEEGGIVIYEGFTYKSSINPRYRLEKNELFEVFGELEILYYELTLNETKAVVVARKL